jgi:hypothetical protein
MTTRVPKFHSALKHGGYSASCVLPGENAAAFAKLHNALIREWIPNGVLEDDIVATMARALWRKRNFKTFGVAKRAQQRLVEIREALVPSAEAPAKHSVEFERSFSERWQAADTQAREELGDSYDLAQMGDEATVDHLLEELEIQDRLDAIIDRCIKRLLLVRGLKSISGGSSSPPEMKRLDHSGDV